MPTQLNVQNCSCIKRMSSQNHGFIPHSDCRPFQHQLLLQHLRLEASCNCLVQLRGDMRGQSETQAGAPMSWPTISCRHETRDVSGHRTLPTQNMSCVFADLLFVLSTRYSLFFFNVFQTQNILQHQSFHRIYGGEPSPPLPPPELKGQNRRCMLTTRNCPFRI